MEIHTRERKKEILALDLASRTGFCRGAGRDITYGAYTIKNKKTSTNDALLNLFTILTKEFATNPPEIVVFESPIVPYFVQGETTYQILRFTYGIAAVCVTVCKMFGIEFAEYDVKSIRTFCLGRNIRSAEAKKAVVAKSKLLGYSPECHNAADAIMLHLYAQSMASKAHLSTGGKNEKPRFRKKFKRKFSK